MVRRRSRHQSKEHAQNIRALLTISSVVCIFGLAFWAYFHVARLNPDLDPKTGCPRDEGNLTSVTVLLVDVTDPLNLPQRQDFINQLRGLAEGIPRHGKLVVTKVDPIAQQLLRPLIVVCNPGKAADVDEWTGNPAKLTKLHEEQFRAPLELTFDQLMAASGAERSPILESIQSVNLTEFQALHSSTLPRRLVVASDLLQNTASLSFYRRVPEADSLITSTAFARARTDLRGVQVELWMLERSDSRTSQPRALAELWGRMIEAENGEVVRLYRISG